VSIVPLLGRLSKTVSKQMLETDLKLFNFSSLVGFLFDKIKEEGDQSVLLLYFQIFMVESNAVK
jgi:hypothetical protein